VSDRVRLGARIAELDGIRGIAISLVVLLHWFVRPERETLRAFSPRLWALLDLCWCGVDLFFVLSGFLIGGILLDHAGAANLFSTFYVRRACRILPVYLLLLLVATLPVPGGSLLSHGRIPLLAYLAFLQNLWSAARLPPAPALAPCWSLAIEEQFYLMLPLLLVVVLRRRFAVLATIALFVPPLLRSLCIASGRFHAWDFTPCRIDAPFWGVLAAVIVRNASAGELLRRHATALRVAALVALCGIAAVSQLVLRDGGEELLLAAGLSLLGAGFATCLLAVLFSPASAVAAALRAPAVVWIGRRSYFIYLFHVAVFEAVTPFAGSLRLPLAAASVAALAALSWRWLETPILRMGASVRYEAPPAVLDGAAS
jgi:peptidoglycan/LPS O-acetylase OafA/YrhL